MTNCTQNSEKTTKNTVEDKAVKHILDTVNHAIVMFNKRSTMHFYVYCEEQITTLLPLARIFTKSDSKHVADQMETTLHKMQVGEPISEITLGAG
jgi:hypothetical protein